MSTEPEGTGDICGEATAAEIERAFAVAQRLAKPFTLSAEEWERVTDAVLLALEVE